MHKEVDLALLVSFNAGVWIINPTVVVETIVLEDAGRSKELLLSELSENTLGLKVGSSGSNFELFVEALVQKFQDRSSLIKLAILERTVSNTLL